MLPISTSLVRLIAQLDASDRALERVSKNLCEEAIDLIKQEFVDERDPYGAPWQPKKAQDGRKTLSGPTSRLKGGWHAERVDEGGFVVAPSVNYAAYHQRGNPRLPRRMMVPDDAIGLPLAWQQKFEETAADVLEAMFRP